MATEATRVDNKIKEDIAAESKLRVAEEARIEGLVNGLDERMEAAEGEIDALQAFKGAQETKNEELAAEDLRIAGLVAKEVTDRGNAVKAVTDNLANNYSDTETVKAMISAVINSLSLVLTDDDKLTLTLGNGANAIAIKTVELNIANDADIQAIIDGLDEEAGE